MAKFMFLFRGGGYATGELASPTELQAHLAKWTTWTETLMAKGKLVAGHPLSHPATGKSLRGREKVVTDGPYAESKDLVSGVLIIEAETLDEAAVLARDCPILDFDGSVEVRPCIR